MWQPEWEWELGINKAKLLYIEWIKNKILFIAQGTILSQYPQINHKGKKHEKHICIIESLCNTEEINTTL